MTFASLWRWLTLTPTPRPDLHVIVYSRSVCPLCDEALAILRRFQTRYGFTLETKDVDESAELQREYGDSVPVVVIAGQVRFRGHVNEVLLKRLLDA